MRRPSRPRYRPIRTPTTTTSSEALTQLGTGEAMVTILSERGAPTPVAAPRSGRRSPSCRRIGDEAIDAAARADGRWTSYPEEIDRESAREKLGRVHGRPARGRRPTLNVESSRRPLTPRPSQSRRRSGREGRRRQPVRRLPEVTRGPLDDHHRRPGRLRLAQTDALTRHGFVEGSCTTSRRMPDGSSKATV